MNVNGTSLLSQTGILSTVGALAGAGVAWGVLRARHLMAPAAILTGVSIAVNKLTQPIFEYHFCATENNWKGATARAVHLALSIGVGIAATAVAASLFGISMTALPLALLITAATVGTLAIIQYIFRIELPTVLNVGAGV